MNKLPPRSRLMSWILSVLSRPLIYVISGVVVFLLDYATGPFVMFPIVYVIPITFAAWFYSKRAAYILAILLPAGRFIIANQFEQPDPTVYLSINALIRIAILWFLAFLVSRTARQTKELSRRINQLEGILPICMFCKRIRDEHQNWHQLEGYITEHSSAQFSHGMCADCQKKHYGEFV